MVQKVAGLTIGRIVFLKVGVNIRSIPGSWSASHLNHVHNLGLHFTGALQICKCVEDDAKLVGWQVLRLVIPAVDSPEDVRVSS
jgi:hypothetical protein